MCINQQDDVEKGYQVQMMGSICTDATHVLVWLGKEPLILPDQYKIDQKRTLGEWRDTAPIEMILLETQVRLEQLILGIESKNGPSVAMEDKLDKTYRMAHSGMMRLFCHPWFRRLRVLQDAGLARSAVALFGGSAVDLPFLFHCGDRMNRCQIDRQAWSFDGLIGQSIASFSMFPQLRTVVFDWHDDDGFLDVLHTAAMQEASDSRDFVYAMLGHPKAKLPDGSLIVEPDYTMTRFDLYCLTAANIVRHSGNLRLLAVVEPTEDHLEDGELPTWVPRWDRLYKYNKEAPLPLSISPQEYRISTQPARFSVMAGARHLRVSGYVVDTVEELTETMEKHGAGPIPAEARDAGILHADDWPLYAAVGFRCRQRLSIETRVSDLCCTLFVNGRSEPRGSEHQVFCDLRLGVMRSASEKPTISANLGDLAPEGLEALLMSAEDGGTSVFKSTLLQNTRRRKLFSTTGGMLGLGSHLMQRGDLCCVVYGCPMPLVLRKASDGYRLLGTLYIQGLNRRAETTTNDESVRCQEFVLY